MHLNPRLPTVGGVIMVVYFFWHTLFFIYFLVLNVEVFSETVLKQLQNLQHRNKK